MSVERVYLGDGAYCDHEGFQFRIWTTRENGTVHEVYLGSSEIAAFLDFMCEKWGYKKPEFKKV